MPREIKAYKQMLDGRWFAGEVKQERMGIGAFDRSHYEPTDTSNGVCFGLSIWWIIKSLRGEDFWGWMVGPGPHVAEIKNMFLSQKGEWDFTRFEAADKKITTETGAKKQNEVLMMEGAQFEHPGYYYISLRGQFHGSTDGSGHAIAFCLNPNGICRYFDPNAGEYETDTLQEAIEALGNLVRSYRISGLKIYWCCWR